MKLSEAIRLGSMLRPQAVRALIAPWGSCAWGAAFEAIGAKNGHEAVRMAIEKRFPWENLASRLVTCPVLGTPRKLCDVIVELNNRHGWTREQIADWVETFETEQALQDAPESVVVAR